MAVVESEKGNQSRIDLIDLQSNSTLFASNINFHHTANTVLIYKASLPNRPVFV